MTKYVWTAQNWRVDEEARQGRSNSGAELVPTDMTGVKKLLAALKRGEIVVFA